MASGLWAGDGLGSEDAQILTQIHQGLHHSLYKEQSTSHVALRKIQMGRPVEGVAGREANR